MPNTLPDLQADTPDMHAGAAVDHGAGPGSGTAGVEARLRALLASGRLDLPLPGGGDTVRRWAELSRLGRGDLAVARLAEGHCDAVAILAEAGRTARPGVLYGVWAARPGGRGARLRSGRLEGTVRFCSGARVVDRALVVADRDPEADRDPGSDTGGHTAGGRVLVDVAIEPSTARSDPGSWNTAAMAGAGTLDVRFDAAPVARSDVLGGTDWYLYRPGFVIGGGGVAAVWWGGAAGLLERTLDHLPAVPDAHQLAHVGELGAQLAATDALLERVATDIDRDPFGNHALAVDRVRCAVERVVRETLDRVPRTLGAGPLSGDADLAASLSDLGIYVRQHHGERDHAVLGAAIVAARTAS